MNKYTGMTINERLYISGLSNDFDKAVLEKDIENIISILRKVELSINSIDSILSKLGLSKSYN